MMARKKVEESVSWNASSPVSSWLRRRESSATPAAKMALDVVPQGPDPAVDEPDLLLHGAVLGGDPVEPVLHARSRLGGSLVLLHEAFQQLLSCSQLHSAEEEEKTEIITPFQDR